MYEIKATNENVQSGLIFHEQLLFPVQFKGRYQYSGFENSYP